MRRYYPGITLFKIIGSILVLASHTMLHKLMTDIGNTKLQFIRLVLSALVPCFYIIAGFLAYHSWTNAENSRVYVKKYLSRIIIVYAFFCMLFIIQISIPELIKGGLYYNNLASQVKQLIAAVILTGPYVQLWFIPPLIFSIAVTYWFFEKDRLHFAAIIALTGFFVSQIFSGSLRNVLLNVTELPTFLNSNLIIYLKLCISRYFGFGFTFVTVGIIFAKYEKRLLESKGWLFIIVACISTIIEIHLLINLADWSNGYLLAFSILPNAIVLLYGVTKIEVPGIRQYHQFLNLSSMVLYFGHGLLIQINLRVLNWYTSTRSIFQDIFLFSLTLVQCLVLTLLIRGIILFSRGEDLRTVISRRKSKYNI